MNKYAINQERYDRSPGCLVRRKCPVKAVREIDGQFYLTPAPAAVAGSASASAPKERWRKSRPKLPTRLAWPASPLKIKKTLCVFCLGRVFFIR
ncbi:hypothetical protein HKBW3S03_01653 [Candidatus Hakubella thermalkaliphila]|uniref:Uncharacterized protein n=1 Tax=Candidatus Hakubella thermalkaliphila TaxID=2754717 RepID=A0A6V8NIJ1_9ACTN|nr:hypothetical protein HKBW3S03_01653 [Candidatus Hakubella thermalkaliphila]